MKWTRVWNPCKNTHTQTAPKHGIARHTWQTRKSHGSNLKRSCGVATWIAFHTRNPTCIGRTCSNRMPMWVNSTHAAQGSNCASNLYVCRERTHTANTHREPGSQCWGGGMRMRVHRSSMATALPGCLRSSSPIVAGPNPQIWGKSGRI